MKKTCMILMVLIALCFNVASAEENLSGIWEGKLVTGPDAELTVQFKIKREADGSYTALINSPDQGGLKNIPATSVTYDSNTLKIDVKEVSGSFEGVVKDNVIDGKWSQAGTSFPLSLKPYVRPTLSEASMDILMGKWQGMLKTPVADLTIVFRFEKTKAGDFVGFLDVPAQSAHGIVINDVILDDGNLTLKVNAAALQYKATLSDSGFDGKWIQGTQEYPLSLKKGGEDIVNRLELSEASYDILSGPWNGKITIPQGPVTVTIVLRFEKTEQGDIVGFLDSPDQGTSGVAITDASLENGTFSVKIKGLRVEFDGKLAGNEMVGEWKQAGRGLPLTLKKGKAQGTTLALSQAAMDQLAGKWHGKVDTQQGQGTLRITVRFEKNDGGDAVGYLDSPDQGRSGIPINEAKLEEGNLTFKVSVLMAEYKGKLSGDTITGQLSLGPKSFDVPLERGK